MPLPAPLAPLVIVIQLSFAVAAQAHEPPADTATLPLPPVAASACVLGLMEYAQLCAPCVRVTVCPAIEAVPLLEPPLVGSTLRTTVPLPVPLAPDATAIQAASLVAVQPHAGPVVTDTLTLPPVAATVWLSGDTPYVHASPSWLMVNVWPATAIVARRVAGVGFAAMLNPIDVDPLPLVALVTATQSALELAVQLQLRPMVSVNEPLPPVAAAFWLAGAIAAVHSGADADCATVKICPPTVTGAERALPAFAATFSVTLPEPVPLRGDAMAIQLAAVSAVHVHEASEVTCTATVPPDAGVVALTASSENWHAAPSCAIDTC